MTLWAVTALASRALERGAWTSPLALRLSSEWARRAHPERSVRLPPRARVIGIGGPTLGGSYKTPLTLALARGLAERGVSVAVVAHGYRARAHGPIRVGVDHDVRDVGDDALWLARDLERHRVAVIVGARREDALSLAAAHAEVIVVDGLLQSRPQRLALSVLSVDATAPWGSGRCPPSGDLRSPKRLLLAAADVVVHVATGGRRAAGDVARDGVSATERTHDLPRMAAEGGLSVAFATGAPIRFESLATARVGLVLAVARPERVVASLAARGIIPVETRFFQDHARPVQMGAAKRPVDVWVATPKCATKLGPRYAGAPVVVLRHDLALPEALYGLALDGTRAAGHVE